MAYVTFWKACCKFSSSNTLSNSVIINDFVVVLTRARRNASFQFIAYTQAALALHRAALQHQIQ